jgi:hypothetical protein
MGACGGARGTAVPASLVVPSASGGFNVGKMASNWLGPSPVARTVSVIPFIRAPSLVVKPEMATLVPGEKLLAAVKVTTVDATVNDVRDATELHDPEEQAPKGAGRSVTSVSGEFVPVEIVLVLVTTSAIAPASQILTYT